MTIDDAATTFAIEFKPHLQEIHIRCSGHTNVFLTQRFLDGKTQHEIGGQRAMVKEWFAMFNEAQNKIQIVSNKKNMS